MIGRIANCPVASFFGSPDIVVLGLAELEVITIDGGFLEVHVVNQEQGSEEERLLLSCQVYVEFYSGFFTRFHQN